MRAITAKVETKQETLLSISMCLRIRERERETEKSKAIAKEME
jgi:hypothetical protein